MREIKLLPKIVEDATRSEIAVAEVGIGSAVPPIVAIGATVKVKGQIDAISIRRHGQFHSDKGCQDPQVGPGQVETGVLGVFIFWFNVDQTVHARSQTTIVGIVNVDAAIAGSSDTIVKNHAQIQGLQDGSFLDHGPDILLGRGNDLAHARRASRRSSSSAGSI